jgi:hypothetical protein
VGSGFGFRPDPFTGHASLHTGLDFPAEVGTPIIAAAGGIVTMREWHAAYGNTLEIDHGNGLVTRYAHTSAFEVERGALVKRGQLVARVGNTGRSTGPHLHFEVLVDGAPQDPARFLAGGSNMAPGREFARRPGLSASAAAVQTAAAQGAGTAAPRPAGGVAASAAAPAAALAPAAPRPTMAAPGVLPAPTSAAPASPAPVRPVPAPNSVGPGQTATSSVSPASPAEPAAGR